MYYSVKIFNNYIMLLFDLLDAIIKFILAIIPALIALISLFIAYYFYHTKNINKESFLNYFYNRGCYIHKDGKCKFDLSKNVKFECPEKICSNKKEHFINQHVLTNLPNESKLSKIITNQPNNDKPNYVCFDGNNCVTKQKNFTQPWTNTCGHPFISNYPNDVYDSIDECYRENIAYKYLGKRECLEMPHGYGWLEGEGCVRGSPEGPNNLNSTFFLNRKNKRLYIPSNPNAYILPLYKPIYRNIL
jgi:hypothetical protein